MHSRPEWRHDLFEVGSGQRSAFRYLFEHLPNPVAVMREITRVLRPGGIVHTHTHLYSSDSGAHDPRLYGDDRNGVPDWAHLRSESEHLMASSCFANKVRLKDYIDGFAQSWPGSKNVTLPSSDTLKVELAKLRSEGRLGDYEDGELLTNVMRTTWRKP